MTHPVEDELSTSLASLVRSAKAVPDSAVQDAQEQLSSRLQSTRSRPGSSGFMPKPRRYAWAFATTLVLAIGGLIALPMLSGSGSAFAAVQERFRHFTTLAMTVTQRFEGQVTQTSQTVIDASGVLRTDVGNQLSVIVDPQRHRVLTLLHEPKLAVLSALPKIASGPDDPLHWLDELRHFKGKAHPLAEPRVIDGRPAQGWILHVQGTTLELWADADGLPLAMRQQGSGLEIDYRFEFDRPIPADQLRSDPPAGYTLTEPDSD